MIDHLHVYADGVHADWNMAGVISDRELELVRTELKAEVEKRLHSSSLNAVYIVAHRPSFKEVLGVKNLG